MDVIGTVKVWWRGCGEINKSTIVNCISCCCCCWLCVKNKLFARCVWFCEKRQNRDTSNSLFSWRPVRVLSVPMKNACLFPFLALALYLLRLMCMSAHSQRQQQQPGKTRNLCYIVQIRTLRVGFSSRQGSACAWLLLFVYVACLCASKTAKT